MPDHLTLQDITYTPKPGMASIISHINLSLQPNTMTTIIGPNGAGKTTLLKIMLGLVTPTSGVITRTPGLITTYMPQNVWIHPLLPLTVQDFLKLSHPRTHRTMIPAHQKVYERLGLPSLLHTSMHHLSGGERQKVLFVNAFLSNPHLMILDEPAQGVDLATQRILYESMEDLRQQTHATILMVSHDIHTVMAYCDQVICLNHHICCHGRPEDVQKHPEYKGLFAGSLPTHLAPYHHHHDHIHGEESDPCR